MVCMLNNSFYKRPNPFWVEYYKKKKLNKEKKRHDTRTRQERQT